MEIPNLDLTVRPYTSADKALLLELIKAVWSYKGNVETKFNDRWWWQWDLPPLYLIEDPDKKSLIGVCGYLPFSLRASGQDVSSAWFVDFFVLTEYQGRGLGKRLTKMVQERFAVTASLSQSDMAYRVFAKLGWSQRIPITLYANFLPLRLMFRKKSKDREVSAFALDQPPPVGKDLDALWARLRDSFDAIGVRDAASIFKRYSSTEQRKYTLLCCYRGNECAGYAVVRAARSTSPGTRRPIGFIVDYLADPQDLSTFSALLSAAASLLLNEGAKRIYCVSTVPKFERMLTWHGFLSPDTPLIGRILRSRFSMGFTSYSAPLAKLPGSSEWFLTMGDCDIDSAWYLD